MSACLKSSRVAPFLVTAVCLASTALLVSRLHYGFLPEDDPALATIAQRTLQGELPNVDFYDNYTGGLSYLNALALHAFGMRLISQRLMLLLFFVPWVAALWYVASQITDMWTASLVAFTGVVWSVPVYPIPYGSWYNLFFATFGVAALFQYLNTGHRRWIFTAGLCGGLSFLIKISGVYFLAAAGLFLLYVEQDVSYKNADPKTKWSGYSVLLSLVLLAFCAVLFRLIHAAGESSQYFQFVVPGIAVCLLIFFREWTFCRSTGFARLLNTLKNVFLMGSGALLPVAIFLVPYIRRHAVSQWSNSILLSSSRIHYAAHAPMPILTVLVSVPLLIVLWANAECINGHSRQTANLILGSSLVVGMIIVVGRVIPSRLVWFSLAESIPLAVVASVLVLWKEGDNHARESSQRLLLLTSVMAICSLIQFPFTAPMYFCFIVPILLIAFASLAEKTTPTERHSSLMTPVFAFYLLFGVFAILPGEFYLRQFERHPESVFKLSKAEGFVAESDAVDLYEQVIPEILRHAGDAPIYAGPDSPELYFLTGHKNATPIYLEFLAGRDSQPERILRWIAAGGVQTVVINHGGLYTPSGPPQQELLNGLRARFPESTTIGRFEIRWREESVSDISKHNSSLQTGPQSHP